MRIGFWNVRSIYEAGALRNLQAVADSYKVDILALQETKYKGCQILGVEESVFFSSGGKDRRFGVGFLVGKRLKQAVVNYEAVSDKICTIRIRENIGKLV